MHFQWFITRRIYTTNSRNCADHFVLTALSPLWLNIIEGPYHKDSVNQYNSSFQCPVWCAVNAPQLRLLTADCLHLLLAPVQGNITSTVSLLRSIFQAWQVTLLETPHLDSDHVLDDADANHDDDAGSMIFLARSCVELRSGDSCDTGMRNGQAVTVCRSVVFFTPYSPILIFSPHFRSHCEQDGCNASQQQSPSLVWWTAPLLAMAIHSPWSLSDNFINPNINIY